MATYGRKMGFKMASNLMRTLLTPSTSNFASNSRTLTTAAAAATATSSFVSSEVITSHTAKWMQVLDSKWPCSLSFFVVLINLLFSSFSEEHTPQVVNPALPCGNQDTSKKSPMELINEVPPIKVEARIVACEGDSNPALGHPIEFICLDKDEPAICKYCGLRYVQDHGHHRQ
ncbi:hypothetical protein TEA_008698 [Camellia sinensis var. sinensis]|uniref:Zinc finger CHCC-type domain-containing protein n=1 Tax=Camellia sinensis var. sinensis TaxID=542762 RepID=A0A4S4E219_CAMSN|nr:hypothetical protein TEA_008698 [Camellia sinensis var. sinensis]